MVAELRISQGKVYELAGITRGEYREWETLLAPAVNPLAKHRPTYTPAQTFGICILAELMHAMDSGSEHLAPISQGFFQLVCSDDWRRLEHRYLVLTLPVERDPEGEPVVKPTFVTVPKGEPIPKPQGPAITVLDLAPFVQRMNTFLSGVKPETKPEQMTLLEKTRHRRSASKSEPAQES